MKCDNDNQPNAQDGSLVVTGRTCTKCHAWKPFEEFNKRARAKHGVNNECRECQKASSRKSYHNSDKEARYEKQKLRRKENPEQRKEWDAAYRERHPDRIKESQKKHYEKQENKRRRAEYAKEWAQANLEKVREKTRKSQAKRNKDTSVRVHNAVSRSIREALGKGGKSRRKTFDLLGYSLEDLKAHIERQFRPGMSWDNYGKWHIDHKIPKAAFNITSADDIDFRRCWSLDNLQPLWAAENKKKKDRLLNPFQPSLALPVPANDNNASEKSNVA